MQENAISLASGKHLFQRKRVVLLGLASLRDRLEDEISFLFPHIQIDHSDQLSWSENLGSDFFVCAGFNEFAYRCSLVAAIPDLDSPIFISPNAFKSPSASVARGSIVFAQSSIGFRCSLGSYGIVFSGAVIEPDVTTGVNCLVGPGAVICQEVKVGNNVLIGAGAVILPGVEIGDNAVIGAGSLIRSSVGPEEKVVGVPARRLD